MTGKRINVLITYSIYYAAAAKGVRVLAPVPWVTVCLAPMPVLPGWQATIGMRALVVGR